MRSTEKRRAASIAMQMSLIGAATIWVAADRVRAADVFGINAPTHAVVDGKADVYPVGNPDTSNTYHSGYVYNIFGATNPGVEGGGDFLFADTTTDDFVEFHTTGLVTLSSVTLEVGGEGGKSDGGRGFSSYKFQQYSDSTYATPVGSAFTYTNDGTVTSTSPLTLATPITDGQYFRIDITPSAGAEGVRVYSLTGEGTATPEPASLTLLGVGGLAMLKRYRRTAIGRVVA